MAIDRTKYMDAREAQRLRTVTAAWAITDAASGARQGVVSWALVDTAMLTGLRVNELAQLRVGDFIAGRSCLRVQRTKRRKPTTETMAIPPELVKHLRDFIAWKCAAGEPVAADSPLFRGKRGPMTLFGMQKIWKVCIRRAGLARELSIHSARHTIAVHLLAKTGNLRHVQKQLGHLSPIVTANLYADVPFDAMVKGATGSPSRYVGTGVFPFAPESSVKSSITLVEKYRKQITDRAERLGLETKELARRASVDRSGLSTFLNGSGNPTLDWVDKVLGALKRSKRPRKKRR